jgi:hypothetical protein
VFKKKSKQKTPWEQGTYFRGMGEDFLGISASWALLMKHAYPEVEHPLSKFAVESKLAPIDVKNLLEKYKNKEATVDELFQEVFETKQSYREFIEQLHLGSNRLDVSLSMFERLNAAKWSQEWSDALLDPEVNEFVKDCLGNLAATKSTHAGFAIDSWDFQDWWSGYYFNSALIGFKAIAKIFDQDDGEFGWLDGDVNRSRIHNIACSLKLTSSEPLHCLQPNLVEEVNMHCLKISEELKLRLKPEFTGLKSISETILLAACDGARIALIGVDPSSVRYFEAKNQLKTSELPWFHESLEKKIQRDLDTQLFNEPS